MRARLAPLAALLPFLLLVTSGWSYAQEPVASFAALQQLVKAGDTVTVSDASGATTKGTIASLTDASLVLRLGADQRTYAESDVSRIRQRRQDSVLNGLLIGAGIGAVFAALGASSCANDFGCNDPAAAFYALGIGVGAGAGMGIDAAIRGERTIFDRLGSRRTVTRVEPWLGRGGGGARVFIGF